MSLNVSHESAASSHQQPCAAGEEQRGASACKREMEWSENMSIICLNELNQKQQFQLKVLYSSAVSLVQITVFSVEMLIRN